MSVWCRFCRGAFGDVSVLIRPPIVYGLSVLDRLCIEHMSADLTPIQDRIKSDITPNCVESADTFPNQNRRVPDISRTQTECKPTTVCGVIPTYRDCKCGWPFRTASEIGRSPHLVAVTWKYKKLI